AVTGTKSGGDWLQVGPTSGSSPTTLVASLNPVVIAGLAAGTYTGSITITPAPGTANTPITVGVTLTVTSAPSIGVNPSSLVFSIQSGGTNNVLTQILNIGTSGPQVPFALTSTVMANPAGKNWIVLGASSGTATNCCGQAPISVDPSNLPAGT